MAVDDLLGDKQVTIFSTQIDYRNKIPGYRAPWCRNARLTTTMTQDKTLKNMISPSNPQDTTLSNNKIPLNSNLLHWHLNLS
eukprot:14016263-Ditylum_brightwellii.AAC.1